MCGDRVTAELCGTRETRGEGPSVDSEPPAGNARTPLRVLDQAPVFCFLVSDKFAYDHRFLV